jgi:hypothetical protein
MLLNKLGELSLVQFSWLGLALEVPGENVDGALPL